MAKNLKLTIKNNQIAEAINLGSLKKKLASKKAGETETPEPAASKKPAKATKPPVKNEPVEEIKEEAPRIKARSHSAFQKHAADESEHPVEEVLPEVSEETVEIEEAEEPEIEEVEEVVIQEADAVIEEPQPVVEPVAPVVEVVAPAPVVRTPPPPMQAPRSVAQPRPQPPLLTPSSARPAKQVPTFAPPPVKLGPTGRHVKDLLPPPRPPAPKPTEQRAAPAQSAAAQQNTRQGPLKPPSEEARDRTKPKTKKELADEATAEEDARKAKAAKFKEFRDVKPVRKEAGRFDARDSRGLRDTDDDQHWRKRRKQGRIMPEDTTIRPASLKIRIPTTIKDLAVEMKLKASQLIQKLFLQGVVVTLNDVLDDETTIQLLGHEFGCEITIDTTEESRIRITDKSIRDEIKETVADELVMRAPVVAFMGHVDHGKTSLIDAIRKSNRAADEAGAITQHIGAFRCKTSVGDIAILDTPGHEAFSAMRARGADVTDIVVLVVAGDEGMRQQTQEAIQHAKAAGVTIIVAINKSDKPNFNAETVYRQLADQELLPESWGGQTITVNCSAVTGDGVQQLLEMLAIQSEILELKASPSARARGTVLESEMHKGLGSVATVLVQNGTLRKGDSVVFGTHWGRIKTMFDEHKHDLSEAGPSTPVEITGLSGLPEAGEEFIVVKSEKEAREIAEVRAMGQRQTNMIQKKRITMENMFQHAADSNKKILNIVLRADVQGSLEALKVALMKIQSDKVDLNIIFTGVGEVSESDVQLAAASKAVVLGFHTQIESHADALIKQVGVQVRLHDIIYHAIDDIKLVMGGLLDKIPQESEKGKAEVKTVFKSSQHGSIAGCQVIEGVIQRSNQVRLKRGEEVVWKGGIQSLKRVKEDVREIQKGFECGILLNGCNDVREGDIIEAYEIIYLTQEL